MKGDPGVIDFLNKGLRHELTAVNQYWLHYRLLDNWGYKALAKQWRKESIEEMQHADKLTTRIIFLDGFPNMQVIDPLHIGQTVKEVLDSDLGAELSARELYQEASTYCHSVKDYVSRDLFEELMADEEDHIDFLETQLDLVSKLGLELYAQHHIGEPDEDERSGAKTMGIVGFVADSGPIADKIADRPAAEQRRDVPFTRQGLHAHVLPPVARGGVAR